MKVKAAVAHKAGAPLTIETVDLDGPRAGEVLVEIRATGICHTDEFTRSGADPEGQLGQSFPKATHLIKAACEAATGKRTHMELFGTDYPTKDGTCVRDYIHVSDLAEAHVKALEYLENGGESQPLNAGYGHGFTVKEVISRVKEITGVNFQVHEQPRRAGDPASLTAESSRLSKLTGWKPKHDDLNTIIKSAYEWEKKRTY